MTGYRGFTGFWLPAANIGLLPDSYFFRQDLQDLQDYWPAALIFLTGFAWGFRVQGSPFKVFRKEKMKLFRIPGANRRATLLRCSSFGGPTSYQLPATCYKLRAAPGQRANGPTTRTPPGCLRRCAARKTHALRLRRRFAFAPGSPGLSGRRSWLAPGPAGGRGEPPSADRPPGPPPLASPQVGVEEERGLEPGSSPCSLAPLV